MTYLAFWIEAVKARGEACKQGGIMGSILLGVLLIAARRPQNSKSVVVAIILYAFAVGLSALAYLFFGYGATKAAEAAEEKATGGESSEPTIKTLTNEFASWIMAANLCGTLEIIALVLGLVFTAVSLI